MVPTFGGGSSKGQCTKNLSSFVSAFAGNLSTLNPKPRQAAVCALSSVRVEAVGTLRAANAPRALRRQGAPDPQGPYFKGPCAQILHALTPKYLYRDYFRSVYILF